MQTCRACGTQNPAQARFCLACGAAFHEPRKGRKIVTILFADLAESTALGERTDPEVVQRLVGRYFGEMRAVIERHGGTVEKFIGDAVMAVFGIPNVHEDDAVRAVRAAIEALANLRSLGLAVRIGINTGEVVAGGGETLVTGDAVNVAARLEQAAKPGEALIGAATYSLIREVASVERLEPLAVKGKSESVVAFRLLGVDPVATRLQRLGAPMVGREVERGLLRQVLDRVIASRRCHLFTVLGAGGVGKSRLATEFVSETGDRSSVLHGRCLAYGDGITYWPMSEIVREAAGVEPGDRPEQLLSRLRSLLDEEGELVAQRIVEALGLAAPSGGDETFWAIRKLLEALARRRPLVVVFDDVHWGEPTFLDLIEHIADWSRDAPLVLLCLARPELLEVRPTWGGGKLNATTVLLEPLAADDAMRLVASLGGSLDEAGRDQVVAAAEGNPLFIEEMVATLGEQGVGGGLPIAPTIHALLAARLDRLDPAERMVIDRGAVEGKVFHRGAVAALSPPGIDLDQPLLSLMRKDLILAERPTIGGDEAFRFRHLLILDAAYDAIPKQDRAELHKALAEWLANLTTEYPEILAHHLERAARYRRELGEPVDELGARAIGYLQSAADAAAGRGDLPAAVSLLSRAVELDARPGLLLRLAETQIDTGDLARAESLLVRAVEAAGGVGDRRVHADAELALSWIRLQVNPVGDVDEARRAAERAITLYEGLGDDLALSRTWARVAHITQFDRNWEGVEHAQARALIHARRAGDLTLELDATASLARWGGSMPADKGVAIVRELLQKTMGNRVQKARLMAILAPLEAMRGRIDEARVAYREAQATYEELGLRFELANAAFAIFTSEFIAGDFAAAEREARRGYDILLRMGERTYLSTLAAMAGEAVYAQGRIEEARAFAILCREAALPDDTHSQTQWRALLAKVLARRGEMEEAERLAREAADRAAAMRTFPQQEGDALMSLAEVLRLRQLRPEAAAAAAQAAAAQAAAAYERKGNIVSAERAGALAAELSQAQA